MIPVSVNWPEDGGGDMQRRDMSTCGVDIMATNNLILWLGRLSRSQRSVCATAPATAMSCTRLTTRGIGADVFGHALLSQLVESITSPVVGLATSSPTRMDTHLISESHTESPCVSQPAVPRASHSAPVVWTVESSGRPT
jgi:hypothetical protein